MKRNETKKNRLYRKNIPATTTTKENDWKCCWMSLLIKLCCCDGFGMCASVRSAVCLFCVFFSHSKQKCMHGERRKTKAFKKGSLQTGRVLREWKRRKNKRDVIKKGNVAKIVIIKIQSERIWQEKITKETITLFLEQKTVCARAPVSNTTQP